jgi:hypothetical protein
LRLPPLLTPLGLLLAEIQRTVTPHDGDGLAAALRGGLRGAHPVVQQASSPIRCCDPGRTGS